MISRFRLLAVLPMVSCCGGVALASELSYAASASLAPGFWSSPGDWSKDGHQGGFYLLKSFDFSESNHHEKKSQDRDDRSDGHDSPTSPFFGHLPSWWDGRPSHTGSFGGHDRDDWHWHSQPPVPIDCDPPTAIPEPSHYAIWLSVAALGICALRRGARNRQTERSIAAVN